MDKRWLAACAAASCAGLAAPAAFAQGSSVPSEPDRSPSDPAAAAPPPAENDAQALAKQLSNPIASLISLPFQSNWDWGGGPEGDGWHFKLNVQPVVPITLNEDWNLVSRTILPIVAQADVAAPPGSQFGLGDTVQSLFFSPQKPTRGGIVWGAGPVFLLPTATDSLTGGKKWGAGPTVVVLKQAGPWTGGALANHIWSFAGDPARQDVSATFLQPFLAYTTRRAMTFSINSESTYDWIGKKWTVPVNFTVAQLLKPRTVFGLPFPIQLQGGFRYYLWKPGNGPDFGVRFSIVALFPRRK